MLMIKLNSSYVLIIITPFRKVSDWVRARPPGSPGKYIEYYF